MNKNFISAVFILTFLMTGRVDPEKSTLDIAGMFNGSSVRVDQRFADSQAINAISGFATVKAHSETYRIFVHSDTHTTDSRNNLEYFIHQYRNALDCPVAIHLGDLTDAQNHWKFMKSAYTDIPQNPNKIGGDTLFVALGNHDIYFRQWEKFKKYWGAASYYFIVETPSGKRDFFIILDSAEGTFGADQMVWFKDILNWTDTQNFRHKIVCTHTHPFKLDASQGHTSNFELEETYEIMGLLAKHNIDMYWCGHDHYREVTTINGITYLVLDALGEESNPAGYVIATMGEKIEYNFVEI